LAISATVLEILTLKSRKSLNFHTPPFFEAPSGGTPLDIDVIYTPVQQSARDLGVVIDSRLSLSEQVASVCRSGYYQLRQLRQAVRCSSMDAIKNIFKGHVTTTRPFSGKLLPRPLGFPKAKLCTKFEVSSSSSVEDMFNRMPKI